MKRTVSIVLSIVMILALAVVPSFADETPANTGTITITLPTTEVAPTADSTYTVYKVFDATVGANGKISYKLVSGKTTAPTGFTVDTAGNVTYDGNGTELTDTDIANIKAYVNGDTAAATVTVSAPATTATVTVPYGYYYITTTNGTVVTVDSTNPNASVIDKNVIPNVVKSAGTAYNAASLQAIAAVGTSQPFTAQINVGKGTTNLVFTDTMTNMTYNGDATVKVDSTEVAAANYTLTAATGNAGFTITFTDAYVASLDAGTVITIGYSGTITSDALSTNPATNTATITSGNGNTDSSETIEVYNAKFTVTKKDGDNAALAGAGFIIARPSTATGAADGAKEYYKNTNGTVTWVASEDDATVYTSDDNGAVPAFTGLGAGTYTLIEKVVPNGYNKAADSTFTISDTDYTSANLEQTATVVNNAGVELPATGGIGTTLFIVFGSVLAVAAGVVIVTNKRAKKEEI